MIQAEGFTPSETQIQESVGILHLTELYEMGRLWEGKFPVICLSRIILELAANGVYVTMIADPEMAADTRTEIEIRKFVGLNAWPP